MHLAAMHNRRFGMAARRHRDYRQAVPDRAAGRSAVSQSHCSGGPLALSRNARKPRPLTAFGDLVSGQTLKIGTRKSVMALAQTEGIARLLRAADTRVAKLDRGDKQRLPDGGEVGPADALVMARSGLERIGMASRIVHDFSVREMLPAVGQGIVAVECVENDWLTRGRLAKIEDASSRRCAEAEREVLWVLNGHCNSPIAGHANIAARRDQA